MSLIPKAGIAYTMILHFFSYDDKIKSDPSYSEDWAVNPQKWKIQDFIPELFTDTNSSKDEQFVDKLIEKEVRDNGIEHFSNDSIANAVFFTPIRIFFLLFLLVIIIVVRRMHGNNE